jgi:ribokinase
MGQVIVVGSINVDITVRVARLPGPGMTVAGGTLSRSGGGKGANQALAAAGAGASVRLIGAIGDDGLGEAALTELAAGGVEVSACRRIQGQATGVAVIMVDERGENQIAVASGANSGLDAAHVSAALAGLEVGPTDLLLTGFELGDGAVTAAVEWAAAAGLRIVLNPAPARTIPGTVLAAHPLLTPNAAEAAELTGESDPERAARALQASTGSAVLVTLGADGALLLDGAGTPTRYPARVVTVVDTTGAGDALNGILAAELALGSALAQAAGRAVAGASLSTRVAGARSGLPTRAELGG